MGKCTTKLIIKQFGDNRPKKTKVVNKKEPGFHILEYGIKFSLFNNIGWEVEAPMA